MAKVTFSLDDETVSALRKAAERSRKPQSLIVREAIAEYTSRDERLSPEEREHLIGVLRRIHSRPRGRSHAAVDRELREMRRSRREGWSRPSR
jgi:metal-responsive CopG/Arc/MetJ family transcriptional regulator